MSILPSTTAASRLVQLRIKLLGEGAFRIERRPDAISALAILPGREFSAKMSLTPEGKHFGRITYPTGRPLTSIVNLADPLSFANFLHTLDAVTFDSNKLPWEASRLINAVHGTDDSKIQSFIKTLYNEGTQIDIPSLATWAPTSSLLTLIGDCLISEDYTCRMAAKSLEDIIRNRKEPEPFNLHESRIQWNQQIDHWIHQAYRRAPMRLEVSEDILWTDVVTSPGLTAACTTLEVRKGDVLSMKKFSEDAGNAPMSKGSQQAKASLQTRNGDVPTGEHFPEQMKDSYFLLVDEKGPLLIARLDDEDLFLYPGPRAKTYNQATIDYALDFLVTHLTDEPGSEVAP